ncbi:uncharacterized protein LOC135225041 [Macrobrachium nipponense]|uniref:uncharacterized protein LOC135225041 n=1 Tax=Macrobrachium nipponense TaxID=159736 RepID=UPI0030C8BBF7
MEGKQKFQQKFILLRVVVVMSGAFLLSPVAGNVQPSVSYFVHTIAGPAFMAANLTFPQESATHIRFGFNQCGCRTTCFAVGPSCQAWSFIEAGVNASECRIIDKGPETTNLTKMTNATYYFKESSVGGKYTWAQDNLLYVELENQYYLAPGRAQCAKIPGHRMLISHSNDTYNFLIQYNSLYGRAHNFWVDLVKIADRLAQWGDGTNETHQPYHVHMDNTATVEPYFVAWNHEYLHDVVDNSRSVLCQANPLGVNW